MNRREDAHCSDFGKSPEVKNEFVAANFAMAYAYFVQI